MSEQAKNFVIAKLREDYVLFMQKMMQMPASQMQKQQAFLRFDEGHMWMQNAVGSYVAPQNPASANDLVPGTNELKVEPEDQASPDETPVDALVITPDEQIS
jgi:hypothetical protein